jgi:pantetheine-phosphate adenylyltransferase
MATAVYAGTFDPATNGHMDIVRRAAALCERLVLAVGARPEKKTLFPSEDRVALLRACVAELGNVSVERLEGLIVRFAREHGATLLVRGVRNAADYAYEATMAVTNRQLAPEIDTLLLVADPRVAHVSSTLVKEIHAAGGDVADFVPPPVLAALSKRR